MGSEESRCSMRNRPPEEWGKIQVFTGDGKGKTTAALGTAIRALAIGKRVAIVYFDKGGRHYSERVFLDWLKDQKHQSGGSIIYVATGLDRIDPETGRFRFGVLPEDRAEAEKGLTAADEFVKSGNYDLVVLDEINSTISLGMLTVGPVVKLLKDKPKNLEVICTGRNAPLEIIELADLVTEMKLVKHYLYHGVAAREGLDY